MGYIPSEEELDSAMKEAYFLRQKHYKVNRLLEERIRQLSRRGYIIIHPEVQYILDNRDGNNSSLDIGSKFVCQHMIISGVNGIEETIESSDDKLVRRLYDGCKSIQTSLRYANDTVIFMKSIKQRLLDQEAADKVSHIRFVG